MTVNDRPRQNETGGIPGRFEEALLSFRDAPRPRGLLMEKVPTPRKLAPYSTVLSVEAVETVGVAPVATGRFAVFHDLDGQEAWDGNFRIVVQACVRIDGEIDMDPVFKSTTWSWLIDDLENFRAGYHVLAGTVIRVLSETFGGLTLTDFCAHVETRASQSPMTPQLGPHLTV